MRITSKLSWSLQIADLLPHSIISEVFDECRLYGQWLVCSIENHDVYPHLFRLYIELTLREEYSIKLRALLIKVSVVYVYTNFLSNALSLSRGMSGKPRVEKSGFVMFKNGQ